MLRLPLIVFIFFACPAFAQQEASNWYFGHRGGLNFSNGNPVLLSNGQMDTDEGVTTMSDAAGNLLFYSNGVSVWDAQHNIMPNGQNLMGHSSSTQAAIAVPVVNDPKRYYLFTTGALGTGSLCYSIINMSLNNGRGDLEMKNTVLQSGICEKITIVPHCNRKDLWVLVHAFNTADFLAFPVTAGGIGAPVVSTTGTVPAGQLGETAIGCMKASPDGHKLAVAHKRLNVDLLDFDNSNGVVSHPQVIIATGESYASYRGAYGVEFSPNSRLLYVSGDYVDFNPVTERSYVLQYNVTLSSLQDIRSSVYTVFDGLAHWSAENFGTLQNAPDGRMYLAQMNQPKISVIHHPNVVGAGCGFTYESLQTAYNIDGNSGGRSMYGLPAFMPAIFRAGFGYRFDCSNNTILFDYERSPAEQSVKWDFGEPASGAANTAVQDSVQHTYAVPGTYTVRLIRITACGADTVQKQVYVGVTNIALGNDTLLCGAEHYLLQPQVPDAGYQYLWQDGSTLTTYEANASGLYWVQITNPHNGCSRRDSIQLRLAASPSFTLGRDLEQCDGDLVSLTAPLANATYLWSNNSTAPSIQVGTSGIYWLEVTKDGCSFRDSVAIRYDTLPRVNLGRDTTICEGATLLLNAGNDGLQYLWQNQSTTQTLPVAASGIYWVKVSNHGCTAADTIVVAINQKPQFSLGADTVLCTDKQLLLTPAITSTTPAQYLWSTGATTAGIAVTATGRYTLTVSNTCGSTAQTIKITLGPCGMFVPTAFSPDGDGRNDVFRALCNEPLSFFHLQVYDRWGLPVFSSNNISNGWKGSYADRVQTGGVYVWLLRYKTVAENKEHLLKGTVLLLR